MKRTLAILLVLLLLLSACGSQSAPEPTQTETTGAVTEQTREPSAATEATEAAKARAALPWSKAFRSKKMPEGELHMDEAAFYSINDAEEITIVNVTKEEILAEMTEDPFPRSHHYEQFMKPEGLAVLPYLDYAMAHGYSRFCVPTTEFHGGSVAANAAELNRMYRINNGGITGLSAVTVNDGDCAYDCVLVCIQGMEKPDAVRCHLEGIAAARRIVEEMPENLSEYDRALYLYQYLTENVRYDYDDYYKSDWYLCYDALVEGKTVCAGYTEALYYLYNLAGVECLTQEGIIAGEGPEAWHIWNVARVDGSWYLFDSTWDEGLPSKFYRFFGISDETMQSYAVRHIIAYDVEHCPPCTETLKHP